MVLFLVWVFLGVLIGFWAQSWNRSFGQWTFVALVFSPLLAGILLVLYGKLGKKCPACGEVVKREAQVCRFCQNKFEAQPHREGVGERKASN